MTEQQARERIMRAMWAELDRQAAIGAGEWHTCAETGLMCIDMSVDPLAFAAALAVSPTPSNDTLQGRGEVREAIARIVDRGAWQDHATFSRKACEQDDIGQASCWLDAAEHAVAPSLKKADEIITALQKDTRHAG